MNQQGSVQWLEERLGRFTSSKMSELMTGGRRPMTQAELDSREKGDKRTTVDVEFGDTALNYILDKVGEIKSGTSSETIDNYATAWGKEYEPVARMQYERANKVFVEQVGFILHPELHYYGGSPDGIGNNDGIKFCTEIKCPTRYCIHYQHCRIKTLDELKSEFKEIYWQCESNILLTNSLYCDFISYHPLLKSMFVFRVPRIDEDCKTIIRKVKAAREILESEAKELGVVLPDEEIVDVEFENDPT